MDMGKPVRIKDLAIQMIELSGLSVRDSSNPDGDIEIVCTGLRPGEKLYEELLIDAESNSTSHPLIFKATENSLSPSILFPKLDVLDCFISSYDVASSLNLLSELVPEWQRGSGLSSSFCILNETIAYSLLLVVFSCSTSFIVLYWLPIIYLYNISSRTILLAIL